MEDASEYELDQPDNNITVTTEDGETTESSWEWRMIPQVVNNDFEQGSLLHSLCSKQFHVFFFEELYDFAKKRRFPNCGFLYGQGKI